MYNPDFNGAAQHSALLEELSNQSLYRLTGNVQSSAVSPDGSVYTLGIKEHGTGNVVNCFVSATEADRAPAPNTRVKVWVGIGSRFSDKPVPGVDLIIR